MHLVNLAAAQSLALPLWCFDGWDECFGRVSIVVDRLLEQVGYCVRFEERFGKQTGIKYLTDGMLVQEAIRDPDLTKYKVHEHMLLDA